MEGSDIGAGAGGLLTALFGLWAIDKIGGSLEASRNDKQVWSDLP